MKTAVAVLLAFLALAAVMSVPVEGQTDNTYIMNWSDFSITATINYHFMGHPGFINRTIAPRNYDHDVYDKYDCDQGSMHGTQNTILITIQIAGSSTSAQVNVGCDTSIVAQIAASGAGADIYQSVYGDINKQQGSVLATIRP